VRKGTITTPPPRPVNEPRSPARREPRATRNVNSIVVRCTFQASRGGEVVKGTRYLLCCCTLRATQMARKNTAASRAGADISVQLRLIDARSDELSGKELKLEDSHLRDVDLAGREFSSLRLTACLLENVSFSNSTIRSSVFRDVRFKGCNLSNAVLRGNQAARVELIDCRLTGFKAIECNWRDVLMAGCDARYVQLNDGSVRISEFDGTQLQDADFRNTNLGETIFVQTALNRADLTGTKLLNADLRGADLGDAILRAEDVKGAIVSPAQAMELARLLGVTIR
jgi:uncharacterized protein YjbI with pentapeptide repeats